MEMVIPDVLAILSLAGCLWLIRRRRKEVTDMAADPKVADAVTQQAMAQELAALDGYSDEE